MARSSRAELIFAKPGRLESQTVKSVQRVRFRLPRLLQPALRYFVLDQLRRPDCRTPLCFCRTWFCAGHAEFVATAYAGNPAALIWLATILRLRCRSN